MDMTMTSVSLPAIVYTVWAPSDAVVGPRGRVRQANRKNRGDYVVTYDPPLQNSMACHAARQTSGFAMG